ncbi:MAG: Holliday junction branch migration protein RuvA [Epsilonproteobacteria bacterium]|nr:Holliday junction branch migration protein RuvA [Campylobacterota bacterium]
MIVGLKGVVLYKEPNVIHLEVRGVVYEVFISLQSFASLGSGEIYLHTSHIIREDANLLYGFLEIAEKRMFERLIKISGVGPKVAMAICSTHTPSKFATIINNKDVKGVQQVPGVGPKSAGRILVELSGFDTELIATPNSEQSLAYNQAAEALEALGFKKEKISKALSECSGDDTAALVKGALKLLQTL